MPSHRLCVLSALVLTTFYLDLKIRFGSIFESGLAQCDCADDINDFIAIAGNRLLTLACMM